MSFLTDLFHGDTGNLGNDLSPSNFFSDTQKDIGGKNTIPELLGGAALATGGLALAGELPFLGAAAGADVAATGGIDAITTDAAVGAADATAAGGLTAADLSAASAAGGWLDTTSFGPTLDAATGAALPANSALTSLTTAAPNAATAASDATISGIPGVADSSVNVDNVTNLVSTTGGTATPASQPSFFNSLVSGASNSITKNPLGIAVAGGLLGYDVLKGNPDSANVNALKADASTLSGQAATLTATGQQLTQYLQNGTLPPAQQAAVTQAVQAAKARIIANAAANGQNTNPTQNSALAQDLAAADMEGLSTAGTLETQLAQTGTTLINSGLNATGLSSEIYQALVKIDQTNNSQLMTAIAGMAAALGGGTKIQIGGTSAPAAA